LKAALDKKAELLKLAQCKDEGQLYEVEKEFLEFGSLSSELEKLENTLIGIAEGVEIADLENQASEIDPDNLPGLIEALRIRIENELDPEIRESLERKGAANTELQLIDGSNEAAIKQEDAQRTLAKIRELAEQYIRVRMASVILRKEIDRYQKEHQDPILKIASKYFKELTQGSFNSLISDTDENGNQILVGICPNGKIKSVEKMSSGSRDQLYLSIRLATVEWRLDQQEPIPFIADDILINFDDERSKSTLKALANLAKKNQVILFTHHNAVVTQAKKLGQDGHIVIHNLTN